MNELVLLTFPSTFYALRAEKMVQAAGLKGKLIPVPRELSSLCGLALELDPAVTAQALYLLQATGIKPERKVQAVKEGPCFKNIREIP
ncbi:DUF3343 domain-containing protein [Moorella naiadis]|uniref:DUF3343 domain-containing protein n=1 Tax=Moorella naiadis (nom. illeg.) TaxID=3093670 RepID=UPI003D9C9577